ncbi:hypothetical protein ACN27E_14810 [Mycobacterium sp. WMMD1722]|uniref:hypothetical protein n=1 Tax=Mycobacterium sp. WMMD1722 TaxID=3404117 RepID=UPI003BF60040
MSGPFVGSEALANGTLSRHQLRTRYRALFPDVYLSKNSTPSLRQRVAAARLWAGGGATVGGLAAAALHGANWIDEATAIELIHPNPRPPRGITTRRDVLLAGERRLVNGLHVTTAARTAFDLGRRGEVGHAVARLDALFRATGLTVDSVGQVARRHPGARGLRQLETVLELVDAGAESPKESWLRLLFIRAGLPIPQTQIPVRAGGDVPFVYLDMGWQDCMVAAEYDGEHHQTRRSVYAKDIRRAERVTEAGWTVVRVVKEDHPNDILRRVRNAMASRSSSVQWRL